MGAAPTHPCGSSQQSVRLIYKSHITSFNDLIRPKLFYAFKNITHVGKGTAHVKVLPARNWFTLPKAHEHNISGPRVPCHTANFAHGQSWLKQISMPAWNKACIERAGRKTQVQPPSSSNGILSPTSPLQPLYLLLQSQHKALSPTREQERSKGRKLLNPSARSTTKQLMTL